MFPWVEVEERSQVVGRNDSRSGQVVCFRNSWLTVYGMFDVGCEDGRGRSLGWCFLVV